MDCCIRLRLICRPGRMASEPVSYTHLDVYKRQVNASFDVKTMVLLAVATSIDALAVGVTFAFLNVEIVPAVSFIGIITFMLSMIGVKIGNVFGARFKSKAELFGGIVLILIGGKILLEHLGILG